MKCSIKILFFIFIFLILSCTKDNDSLDEGQYDKVESAKQNIHESKISIDDAIEIFNKSNLIKTEDLSNHLDNYSESSNCFSFEPIWYLAREVRTRSVSENEEVIEYENTIVTVPILIPDEFVVDGMGVQLVFYPNGTCDTNVELVIYKPIDGNKGNIVSNCNFSGGIIVVNFCLCTTRTYAVNHGYVYNPEIEFDYSDGQSCSSSNFTFKNGDNEGCDYSDKGPSFGEILTSIWVSIRDFIIDFVNGSGNAQFWTNTNWTDLQNDNFPFNEDEPYLDTTTVDRTDILSDYFNSPFFNGEGNLIQSTLDGIIEDLNLITCADQLHETLFECLSNSYENEGTGVDECGLGEFNDGINPFDYNEYINILVNDPDAVASCLIETNVGETNGSIDVLDGEANLICFIITHFPDEEAEVYSYIKSNCASGTTKEERDQCASDLAHCLKQLDDFNDEFGLSYSAIELHEIAGDACGLPNDEFEDEVIEGIAQHYVELMDDPSEQSSIDSDNSFFPKRTLSCESFNGFKQQSSGSGWIGCVDNLYLSKNLGGAYAATELFCVSFTVPRVRYNGQKISKGIAQDCAAWAANAAAMAAGYAFAENPLIEDSGLIILFRKCWNISMESSDCGYGSAVDCLSVDCTDKTSNSVWNEGFFEWMSERMFGCGG